MNFKWWLFKPFLLLSNKRLGGTVGASLIEHIYRLQRSSLPLPMCIVTIPYFYRINHLFQNGRALLKCQIFLPPTTGNPDVENSRSHAPRYDTYVPIVNRHIKTVLIFFVPVFCVPVSCFLCCCWVPLQPQFRQFHRELFLIFVCLFRKFDRFWRL
jgi:hypothetical protein